MFTARYATATVGPSATDTEIIAAIPAKSEAEKQAELEKNKTARTTEVMASTSEMNMLSDEVKKAKDMSSSFRTGLIGSIASTIPGTEAHNLSKRLDSIKAIVGFDKLSEMRRTSPTGGALGNITERELALLQAVWGSVEQSQTKEQFNSNLDRLEKQAKESWDRVNAAYELDYGTKAPSATSGGQSLEDRLNRYK